MTDSILQSEIDRMIESLDGELTSHSRVIDGLLDLRSASGDDVKLVAVIDESLKNIPGRTAVATEWWKTQLTTFRLMTDDAVGAQQHTMEMSPSSALGVAWMVCWSTSQAKHCGKSDCDSLVAMRTEARPSANSGQLRGVLAPTAVMTSQSGRPRALYVIVDHLLSPVGLLKNWRRPYRNLYCW